MEENKATKEKRGQSRCRTQKEKHERREGRNGNKNIDGMGVRNGAGGQEIARKRAASEIRLIIALKPRRPRRVRKILPRFQTTFFASGDCLFHVCVTTMFV